MSERRGTKALEVWCRRVTDGYPGVKVENMTTSWRDGLAFCAMIHHFRPDLIDFNSLDKRDVFRNNELAFRIAERHLGIPALLDAEDMVEYEVPDRLSMLTYLSQFYQTFVGQQGHSPNGRTPIKRSSVSPSLPSSPDMSPNMSPSLSPTSSSPPSKVRARGVASDSGLRSQRDPCTHCGLPVFLAERLLVGNKRLLYHRTCFRCARCSTQLTLANFYETEDGHFCCETCPDEENDKSDTSSIEKDGVDSSDVHGESLYSSLGTDKVRRNLSLSDDEKSMETKSESLTEIASGADEYSTHFESALEKIPRSKPSSQHNSTAAPLATTDQLSHDLFSISDESLQKSLHNNFVNSGINREAFVDASVLPSVPGNCGQSSHQDEFIASPQKTGPPKSLTKDLTQCKSEKIPIKCENNAPMPPLLARSSVYKSSVNSDSSSDCQHVTASTEPSEAANCTKDSQFSSADDTVSSIVKMRMKIFEDRHSAENAKVSKRPCTLKKSEQKVNLDCEDREIRSNDDSNRVRESMEKNGEEITEQSVSDKGITADEPSSIPLETIEDGKHTDHTPFTSERTECAELTEESSLTSERSVSDSNPILNQPHIHEDDHLPSAYYTASILKPTVSPRKIFQATKPSSPIIDKQDEESISSYMTHDYPDELNPFGDEEEEEDSVYSEKKENMEECDLRKGTKIEEKVSTNPFGSSDEDENDQVVLRKQSPHKPPRPPPPRMSALGTRTKISDTPYIQECPKTISVSPGHQSTSPVPAQRRIIPAPANLNPFYSEGEDSDGSTPVPLPRTIKITPEPSPRPQKSSAVAPIMIASSGHFGSTSSLTSMTSTMSSNRRSKKPAPPPPVQAPTSVAGSTVSTPSSPSLSSRRSPRPRKARPAPQPPAPSTSSTSPIPVEGRVPPLPVSSSPPPWTQSEGDAGWDGQKTQKDEANRCKKAGVVPSMKEDSLPRDKSTYGQWKRKKGPAPPRPVPQRRQIRAMPLKEVKRELDDIEVKQLELERQGVQLERTIRCKFGETPGAIESSMTPDVEDLVLQLFELVNEKNELFRRQAELMYLRRQQRLEEEHADLEYQIRCLMERPELNKTDSDKAREEELIKRLVEVVERRNEIVECLEMDRLREAEEDQSIHTQLDIFAAKGMAPVVEKESPSPTKSKKDKKKKEKDLKKVKKGFKVDADKDIDEVEAATVKDKKVKKKWF